MTSICSACNCLLPASSFKKPNGNVRSICSSCYQKKQLLHINSEINRKKISDDIKNRSIYKYFEWCLHFIHINNLILLKETNDFIPIELNVYDLIDIYNQQVGLCAKSNQEMKKIGFKNNNGSHPKNATLEIINPLFGYIKSNIRLCMFSLSSVTFSPLDHIDQLIAIIKAKIFQERTVEKLDTETFDMNMWKRSKLLYVTMFDEDGNLRDPQEFNRLMKMYVQ